MKKELKRLKVIEKREEPFSKGEIKVFYMKMNDGRSRYDGWRRDLQREGFKRSESNPGYFRTDS